MYSDLHSEGSGGCRLGEIGGGQRGDYVVNGRTR